MGLLTCTNVLAQEVDLHSHNFKLRINLPYYLTCTVYMIKLDIFLFWNSLLYTG
jgi:hypothetical protein